MCWVHTQAAGHHNHQYCVLSQSDVSWWLKWTKYNDSHNVTFVLMNNVTIETKKECSPPERCVGSVHEPFCRILFLICNVNPVSLKDQATSSDYFLSSYRSVVSPSFLDTVTVPIWFVKTSNTLRSYKLSVFCLKHHVEASHMLTAAKCGNAR